MGLEWEYPGLVHGSHRSHQYYRQRLAHTSAREWDSSPAHRATQKELARAMRKHQAPQHDYSVKVVVAGDWRVGKVHHTTPTINVVIAHSMRTCAVQSSLLHRFCVRTHSSALG
jgi:hypothetical protein